MKTEIAIWIILVLFFITFTIIGMKIIDLQEKNKSLEDFTGLLDKIVDSAVEETRANKEATTEIRALVGVNEQRIIDLIFRNSKELEEMSSKIASLEDKSDYNINISETDKKLLQRLLYAECGNEPIEGQAQVLFCIFNRLGSGSLDFRNINTIEEAVYQHTTASDGHKVYQFSCVTGKTFADESNHISDIDWDLLIGKINNGKYMNNGNLFYCRDYCNSWHMQNLQYIETVGLHEFYKYKIIN